MSMLPIDAAGWAGQLIDIGVKSVLLVACALLADWWWLRRRPLAADALWSSTLFALVALPIICVAAPRYAIPLPSIAKPEISRPAAPTSESGIALAAVEQPNGPAERPSLPLEPVGISTRLAGDPDARKVATLREDDGASAPSRASLSWPAMMIAIYAFGLAAAGCRLGLAYRHVRSLRRRCTPMDDEPWDAALCEARRRVEICGEVELLESPDVAAPLTLGWRRPVIVLPAGGLPDLEHDSRTLVLMHELTHIARGDYLVQLLARFVGCVYWCNPLMLLAERRQAHARELICDGVCVASAASPEDYVELLLSFAGRLASQRRLTLGLTIVARSRLERRLAGLSPLTNLRAGRATRLAAGVGAVSLAALLASATFGQTPASGDEADSEPQDEFERVVAALQAAEESITSLAATYEEDFQINLVEPGEPLPSSMLVEDDAVSMHRRGRVSWQIESSGAARMEADYEKTNTRFDNSTVEKGESYLSVFDGLRGVIVTTILAPDGWVKSKQRMETDRLMRTTDPPFDFATWHSGDPISKLLTRNGGTVIGEEELDARTLLVVETAIRAVREDYHLRQRFWLDPSRNHLAVRRQSFVQRGDGAPWALGHEVDLTDIHEEAPGIWLPREVRAANYNVTSEGQGHVVSRDQVIVTKWEVNPQFPPGTFRLPEDTRDQVGDPVASPQEAGEPSQPTAAAAASAPPGTRFMRVRTVDEQGEPVAGARIFVNLLVGQPRSVHNTEYFTGADGGITVLAPVEPIVYKIWAQKPGYVPLLAVWMPEIQADGGKVTGDFTFRLPTGTTIGGVVRDEEGRPIAGAMVEATLANYVDDLSRRPNLSMQLALEGDMLDNPCRTDADGRWSFSGVPAGEAFVVRLKVTHPDYKGDADWGGLQREQRVGMDSLRDGSAVIVMQPAVE